MIAAGELAQYVVLHALSAVAGDIGGVHVNADLGMGFEIDGHNVVVMPA
jgi:hypothetical protein